MIINFKNSFIEYKKDITDYPIKKYLEFLIIYYITIIINNNYLFK